MSIIKKRYTNIEKLEIVKVLLEEHTDLKDVAQRYSLNPNTIVRWQRELSIHKNAAFPGNGNPIPTEELIDLVDRMVVGWLLSKNMATENTVCKAYRKAIKNRGLGKQSGLMIHSDRGVLYVSHQFRYLIKQHDCIQSMSIKGNCWGNAVSESFFKTIKTEALKGYTFSTIYGLEDVEFMYIDGFYNNVRIHSSLGELSPVQASLLKNFYLAA